MEFQGFLPLVHDDLPHLMWGMGGAFMGLHACCQQSGTINITEYNIDSRLVSLAQNLQSFLK